MSQSLALTLALVLDRRHDWTSGISCIMKKLLLILIVEACWKS